MLSFDAHEARTEHADRLVGEISAYLHLLWLSGVLVGDEPTDAFYVRCDDEVSDPELAGASPLIVEVGFSLADERIRFVYFSG